MKSFAFALTTSLVACLAAAAQAFPGEGTNAAEFAAWMQSQGLTATTTPNTDTPSQGYSDTLINAEISGLKYQVYFYGCEQGRCSSVQFAGAWSSCRLTVDQMNLWNTKRRYGRSHLDADRQFCWLEMDFDMVDASARFAQLETARWIHLLGNYGQFVHDGTIAANSAAPGQGALASLVVGQTTETDVLNRAGAPAERRLSAEGASLSYALGQLRGAADGGKVAAARGVMVQLDFDRQGVLRQVVDTSAVQDPAIHAGGHAVSRTNDATN